MMLAALTKTKTGAWIFSTSFAFFGLLAVMLNILEVWLILNKSKRKTCFDIILLSLSSADLINGATYLAGGIYSLLDIVLPLELSATLYGTIIFYSSYPLMALGVGSSLGHILLITSERIIAVYFPLKLRMWITKNRTLFGLFTIWCVTLVSAMSMVYVLKNTCQMYTVWIVYSSTIFLMSFSMPVLYALIARKAISASRQQRQRFEIPHGQEPNNRVSNNKKERLIVINSGIVTLCFILCNMPMAVYPFFKIEKFMSIIVSIMALNPVLDPIVYFLSSYYTRDKRN